MIELRWEERVVERGGSGLDAWARTERVLQYRQSETYFSGMTGKQAWRMSEWTDVPTVREDG